MRNGRKSEFLSLFTFFDRFLASFKSKNVVETFEYLDDYSTVSHERGIWKEIAVVVKYVLPFLESEQISRTDIYTDGCHLSSKVPISTTFA